MPRKSPFKRDSQPEQRTCDWPDCHEVADYPAPKRRMMPQTMQDLADPDSIIADDLNYKERQYFCLQHVREFNKRWDFFAGMSPEEIDRFEYDAMLGHRKTKFVSPHPSLTGAAYAKAQTMRDGDGFTTERQHINIPKHEQHAMDILELAYPLEMSALKANYKKLVKQHHPDRGGDEEQFKAITNAYHLLKASLA